MNVGQVEYVDIELFILAMHSMYFMGADVVSLHGLRYLL